MAAVHSSDFIGRDPIPKLLLRFATPAVISTFINCLYNIVDRLYIGRGVGANAQAGLSLTFPIMIILMAFGMMVGQGSSAVVSLLLGKKDVDDAEKVVGQAVAMFLLFVITFRLELKSVCLLIDIAYAFEKLLGKIMLPVVLPFEEYDSVIQDLENGKRSLILFTGVIISAVDAFLNESAELCCVYLDPPCTFAVRASLIRDKTMLTDKGVEPVTLGVKTVAAAKVTHIRQP